MTPFDIRQFARFYRILIQKAVSFTFMAHRTKPVDLVFVVDATASTECVFQSMKDCVIDQAFAFHTTNRDASDHYGVVIYRDPVDLPTDVNEFFQLTESREMLDEYLGQVKSYGGRDDPEDWAGGLDLALHLTNWRNGEKCIFWITDANAHGQKFSGDPRDTHNDQVPRLEGLIREMAQKRIYFVGINIRKGRDSGCERTLNEMKRLYEAAEGPGFRVQDFPLTWDRDKYDGDGWPPEVMEKFQETITGTMSRAMGGFMH
jgi:hypothetical protein